MVHALNDLDDPAYQAAQFGGRGVGSMFGQHAGLHAGMLFKVEVKSWSSGSL